MAIATLITTDTSHKIFVRDNANVETSAEGGEER